MKKGGCCFIGLDNGIVIKCKSKEEAQSIIDEASTHLNSLDLYQTKVEVCYWRKCWNIRREIISVLHMNRDEVYHAIDLEDIKPIIKRLSKFLDKETWDNDDNGSIWEFEEYRESILWNILNLSWLYYYKIEHPEIEIEFYDSY